MSKEKANILIVYSIIFVVCVCSIAFTIIENLFPFLENYLWFINICANIVVLSLLLIEYFYITKKLNFHTVLLFLIVIINFYFSFSLREFTTIIYAGLAIASFVKCIETLIK
jgi:hypothetical protein